MSKRTALSLFTGAGGLDLGFEFANFRHVETVENDPWCTETLRKNRPEWNPLHVDVREYGPQDIAQPDVLIAGPPCQGFSLGGNRRADDPRNTLYREVIRIAKTVRPRVVIIENVLNLRTMRTPDTGRSHVQELAEGLTSIGYDVRWDIFRMSRYGVPQTRRRFIFLAVLGRVPEGFAFPAPDEAEEPIKGHVYDLAQAVEEVPDIPNHEPIWGFKSRVHEDTGEPFDLSEEVVPIRISRTASDGYPIRSFDEPFPAVDTATVWGWARGNVRARRIQRHPHEASPSQSKYANPLLWRVSASQFRKMTPRELARLQTFPDTWSFVGGAVERDTLVQIGNAVPVEFARRLGLLVQNVLDALEAGAPLMGQVRGQPSMF